MGHYFDCYTISDKGRVRIGGVSIGTNGAGPLLVEQWIAGWSIHPLTDPAAGRKASYWFEYTGKKHQHLRYSNIASTEHMKMALQDDSEDCTWVRGRGLDHAVMSKVQDKQLHAMLSLWICSTTLYQYSPLMRVTPELAAGILRGTEQLEAEVASWHKICRDFCTIIQRAAEQGGYVSIG